MIVVDTSALVAIMLGEPMATVVSARLGADAERRMSVVSYVEAGTVIAGRQTSDRMLAFPEVDAILNAAHIRLEPVNEAQARIALEARIRFGRGFDAKAKLNFGDSFAYALAKSLNAPLLFVGNDFSHTDIQSALAANT